MNKSFEFGQSSHRFRVPAGNSHSETIEQFHDGWSIGSFRSDCNPPSTNGTPTVSLDKQNRLDFNTERGGGSVCSRACIEIETDRERGEGVLTHEFIPLRLLHEKCSASAWNKFQWIYVVAHTPFHFSILLPSPPLIVSRPTHSDTLRALLVEDVNTLLEQKSTRKSREGGGIGVLPRGNEKWPTCQCALSHRDKSHAGSETLRLLTRKIPGGKSRECGNVRAPNPSPSSSLTVDDGKLEKYQIEFGSWRTVIKSFEFLLPLPPHLSLFSHRQIDPLLPPSVYSYNTPRRLSRLKFCIQSDRFVRTVVSRDKRFI